MAYNVSYMGLELYRGCAGPLDYNLRKCFLAMAPTLWSLLRNMLCFLDVTVPKLEFKNSVITTSPGDPSNSVMVLVRLKSGCLTGEGLLSENRGLKR